MDRVKSMLAELDAEIAEAEARVAKLRDASASLRAALGVLPENKQMVLSAGSGKTRHAVSTIARESKARAIYEYLGMHPGADFGSIAKTVYGEDNDDTRHKVRAQIFSMSSRGKLMRKRRGEWHVVANGNAAPEDKESAM